jgi:hypothetical protein
MPTKVNVASSATETPHELRINIKDLQHACELATPTTSISLLQRCQALVEVKWMQALDVLPAALQRLVHLHYAVEAAGSFEKPEEEQKSADELLMAIREHTCIHPMVPSRAGKLRLSGIEAAELCNVWLHQL